MGKYGAEYDSSVDLWAIWCGDSEIAHFEGNGGELSEKVTDSFEKLAAESLLLVIMLKNLDELEPPLKRFVKNLLVRS